MVAPLVINSASIVYSTPTLAFAWNVSGSVSQVGGPTLTIDTLNITATDTTTMTATYYSLTMYNSALLNVNTSVSVGGGLRTYTNTGSNFDLLTGNPLGLTLGHTYNFSIVATGTSQTTGFPPPAPTPISSAAFLINGVTVGSPACFLVGTQIRCLGVYQPIETLEKGMLVDTINHGSQPIVAIGRSVISPTLDTELTGRLFRYRKETHPELIDDLVVTGGHSRMVASVTVQDVERMLAFWGRVYTTDRFVRMPAAIDKTEAEPAFGEPFRIYHLTLGDGGNNETLYAIDANGLTMETCPMSCLTSCLTLLE